MIRYRGVNFGFPSFLYGEGVIRRMETTRPKGKARWTKEHEKIVMVSLAEVGSKLDIQPVADNAGLTVRTVREKVCKIAKRQGWTLNPGITTAVVIERMPDEEHKPKVRPSVYTKPSEPDIDRTTKPEQTRYAFKFRVSDDDGWSDIVHLFASGVDTEQALSRALSMIGKRLDVELLNCTTAMELVSTREAMINLGASKRYTRENYGFNN